MGWNWEMAWFGRVVRLHNANGFLINIFVVTYGASCVSLHSSMEIPTWMLMLSPLTGGKKKNTSCIGTSQDAREEAMSRLEEVDVNRAIFSSFVGGYKCFFLRISPWCFGPTVVDSPLAWKPTQEGSPFETYLELWVCIRRGARKEEAVKLGANAAEAQGDQQVNSAR